VDGSHSLEIKFYGELIEESKFNKELLKEFLDAGFAAEQFIDGQKYIRMTNDYYNELGEYIILHPKELCREYWNNLVEETKYCDVLSFVRQLCRTHMTIKKLTKDKIDFCETIGEELDVEI
jgi:hypothetical protein